MEELLIHYMTENQEEVADIKVVLSLLKNKTKKTPQPCDSPLKRLVNHQPDGHSTSPLVSSTRGKELRCQSLVSYLTPVGPHHTQLVQGATLSPGGARLKLREEEEGGLWWRCEKGGRRRRRGGEGGTLASWTSLSAPLSGS